MTPSRAVIVDYPSYGPYDPEAAACAAAGWELEVVSFDAFAARRPPADVVLNVSGDHLDAALLAAVGCRVAVGYGVGLDWIDLDAAARDGRAVVHMPLANVPDVAQHALALILACERRLLSHDATVRGGGFDSGPPRLMRRPSERTLGLVAFGNIARRLAGHARALGFPVLAHDPGVDDATVRVAGVEPVADLDDLLRRSHVLSVHVPATPSTRHLLERRRLALLPAGATVVVTSRGAVYDPRALADALVTGHVGAAGIDVFDPEPPGADHPLLAAPNVILTPHLAGLSADALDDMHRTAADVIRAVARGDEPPGLVGRGT